MVKGFRELATFMPIFDVTCQFPQDVIHRLRKPFQTQAFIYQIDISIDTGIQTRNFSIRSRASLPIHL